MRACADPWRDFALPPGTQLSMVKKGVFRRELRTAGQDVLVSARYHDFSRDGRAFKLSRVEAAQWPGPRCGARRAAAGLAGPPAAHRACPASREGGPQLGPGRAQALG